MQFDAQSLRRIDKAVLKSEREAQFRRRPRPKYTPFPKEVQPLQFRNDHGSTIQPGSIIKTDSLVDFEGQTVLKGVRPDAVLGDYAIVLSETPANKLGTCLKGYGFAEILGGMGSVPVGTTVGPTANSFAWQANFEGFAWLGPDYWFVYPITRVYGVAAGAISRGSSGTVNVRSGQFGTESGFTITAHHRFGSTTPAIDEGREVECEKVNNTWVISAAQC